MTPLEGSAATRPAFGRRWVPSLLITATATLAVALPAGAADATVPSGPSSPAAAARTALVTFGDDDPDVSAADDGAADADPDLADDGAGDPVDGAGAVDDGSSDGDGSADDGAADDAPDDVVEAVAIDARRRASVRPRTFAARRARATGLTWTAWGAPTATARGRVTVAKKGRHGKTVRAAGTVTFTRLTRCADATSVYRRAVITVAGKKVAKVSLPGCSALR
ncbi:hypothetical protein [Patulibacter sp.]|uniref:hypothetical protein n=1 Tax=Patulibacter sp. TaxID=1912859 RepID=UPI002718FB21|nr:hypothetical protein [Patulibacter sp.]MDO9408476.1 hypothetical protein [Patulibacter sp.]